MGDTSTMSHAEFVVHRELPPIQQWFDVRRTPDVPPSEFAEQWVGVLIPLRYRRNMDMPIPFYGRALTEDRTKIDLADSITVKTHDALKSLRYFQRYEAAQWWQSMLHARGTINLGFETKDGAIISMARAEQRVPGISDFDSIDL